MKTIISVALLLFSVDASSSTVDGLAADRFKSPPMIQLAASLGCAANCTYVPTNVPQAFGCAIGAQLGALTSGLWNCGAEHSTEFATTCTTRKQATASDVSCVELAIPTDWQPNLSPTFCVPKIIDDKKDQMLAALVALSPLYEGFKAAATSYGNLMYCLKKGVDETTCPATICTECTGIPAKFFSPMTSPPTKLCLPALVSTAACALIQDASGDANRGFCPGKNPKDKVALPCSKDQCPKDTKVCPTLPPKDSGYNAHASAMVVLSTVTLSGLML